MMFLFGVIGIGGGIAVLRFRGPLARFFRNCAGAIAPERLTRKVYTGPNLRWAGGGYIAFGVLATGILIWRLCNGYGFA